MSLSIRIIQAAEIEAYVQHCARVVHASGRDGDILSDPRPRNHVWDAESARKRYGRDLPKKLDQEGWRRAWGAWDGDRIVGHVTLTHKGLNTQLHRAMLGMGIERPYRKQGLGTRLMGAALDWAREAGLAWVDLGVLAHNEPARRLYRSCGFVEIGRVHDAFRVDGSSIDDVMMALELTKRL